MSTRSRYLSDASIDTILGGEFLVPRGDSRRPHLEEVVRVQVGYLLERYRADVLREAAADLQRELLTYPVSSRAAWTVNRLRRYADAPPRHEEAQ